MKQKSKIPLYILAISTFIAAVSVVIVMLLVFTTTSTALGASPVTSVKINLRTITNEPNLIATAEPCLIITGYILLDNDTPLEKATIYRSYAAYAGSKIAVTDSQGYYDSGCYPIPGREMVTVWAEKEGYNFEPLQYSWLHEYGFENRSLNFVATSLITETNQQIYLPFLMNNH